MNQEELYQFMEYGDKKFFNKMLKRGYRKVAIGIGAWRKRNSFIDKEKIDSLAFFHPNWNWFSRVRVYEYYYVISEDGFEKVTGPHEQPYTGGAFNKYLKRFKISMDEKKDLSELVKELEKQEAVN